MFEQAFKNIDDILHKDAGVASELDDLEKDRETEAELVGRKYKYIIESDCF